MTQPFVQPEFISAQTDWDDLAKRLTGAKHLALDLESNGYFRYPERICLLQIAVEEGIYLVDTLTVRDLRALGSLLNDAHCLKIMHACDNDLRVLDRDYGFRVRSVYDTAVAARFTGLDRLGLATVLQTVLGIELPKSKALQRQDWTLRPLAKSSLEYAAGDVAYLFDLQAELNQRLQALGRSEWVREECERMEAIRRAPETRPEDLLWSISGSRSLTNRERAVLRELVMWRDRLCRQADRVPFRVVSDEVLLGLARDPKQDFQALKELNAVRALGALSSLRQALNQGRTAPPIPLPATQAGRRQRRSPAFLRRLKELKAWRVSKGKALGLDQAVIWPLPSLERMAENPSLETPNGEVRQWQHTEFSREVEHLLRVWEGES
ncbi:MAG: HRDC domain-containing protein [candidate division FCPU426 bacterium]